MTPAPDPDRGQPEEGDQAEPARPGVRDLVAAYPWLPVALGLLVVALSAWCFAGLAEQVHEGGPLLRLDEHLLRFSLQLRSAPLIAALSVLTWLGDMLVVVPVALVAGALIWFTRGSWVPLLLLAISAAGVGLTVQLIKIMIARPRPVVVSHLVVEDGFGFPSGHSAQSAACYLLLGALGLRLLRTRRARAWALAAAVAAVLITGFSRVLLGVHSPSDVLAGWVLGACWAALLLSAWLFAEQAPRLIADLVARKQRPGS